MKHKKINFESLYYGFPVILLTTIDNRGLTNITPISSSWVLGNNIIIGLGTHSKSFENLKIIPEAVLNLPDETLYKKVEKIAPYTGIININKEQSAAGYKHSENKFLTGKFTQEKSINVRPDKIKECPLQIETKLIKINLREWYAIIELEIISVYAFEEIITNSTYINPDKWKPLIYNFRKYHGLSKSIGENFKFKNR